MIAVQCKQCKSLDLKPGPYEYAFVCNNCGATLELHNVKMLHVKDPRDILPDSTETQTSQVNLTA